MAAPSPDSLVDRLTALPVFEEVPRADLEWLAAHGELRTIAAGQPLLDNSSWAHEMMVVLEGRGALYSQTGSGKRKLLEGGAGRVLGILPFSRIKGVPGLTLVEEDMTLLVLNERYLSELTRDHEGLTTALVHHMVDRSREFRSVQLNDDRLQSLSRLASGFAHELNNPASAASRTAKSLIGLLDQEERAARELAAARLTDDQLAVIDAVREDDIAEWLDRHGLESGIAEALAAGDVTIAGLDKFAGALPRQTLGMATRWIASGCAARSASRQIEVATGRIHELVSAVKGFTFMDREGVPEDVDVARGLADTLAMLESKVRAKSATVHLETATDLPRVKGFGSEINQVWEKVVDNALDAIGPRGNVTITATTRGDSLLVRVVDDGPGIPEEIRARIFDPFFTTKPVGQGTGLGLDMARRILNVHGGDIDFSTQPGRTVFRVRLPAAR
jgi:signal transduction histidine kinase